MKAFPTLHQAVQAMLDRWIYRPGLLTPAGRMRLGVNWDITVRRDPTRGELRFDRRGRGWKRNTLGMWVPIYERFQYANLITTAGKNYAADAALSGGTQITTWYHMAMSASPSVAAADTMSSHGGWTEFTDYDESVRQTYVEAGVSAGVVTNAASPSVITSSSNSNSVGGMALTSVSTKSGTTGTLFAAGAFSTGNKALDAAEMLTSTSQFTFADDGA